MSCNKSDRKDLQTIENNILRTCYNVRLVDRLSLVGMHREASLVSLEQIKGGKFNYTVKSYVNSPKFM